MKNFCLVLVLIILNTLAWQLQAAGISGGQVIGKNIYGLAIDYQGDPLILGEKPLIYPQSNSEQVVVVDEAKFKVSVFNDTIGSIYLSYFDKKMNSPFDTEPLPLENTDGLTNPASTLLTPWNTVLLSESTRIDGAAAQEFIENFSPYYKGKANLVLPYNYGWISEVIVLDAQGKTKSIKNYAMGRLFASQVLIMPDAKTFYLIDDLGNLYCFIAEQAESTAKGHLYVITQNKNELKYELIGEGSALKLKFKLRKMEFSSLFKVSKPTKGKCKNKYEYIQTIYGEECLSIKRRNKKYVGFFEPIRFMALNGFVSIAKPNSQIKYDSKQKQVFISNDNQVTHKWAVGDDQIKGSQFILKESL